VYDQATKAWVERRGVLRNEKIATPFTLTDAKGSLSPPLHIPRHLGLSAPLQRTSAVFNNADAGGLRTAVNYLKSKIPAGVESTEDILSLRSRLTAVGHVTVVEPGGELRVMDDVRWHLKGAQSMLQEHAGYPGRANAAKLLAAAAVAALSVVGLYWLNVRWAHGAGAGAFCER